MLIRRPDATDFHDIQGFGLQVELILLSAFRFRKHSKNKDWPVLPDDFRQKSQDFEKSWDFSQEKIKSNLYIAFLD